MLKRLLRREEGSSTIELAVVFPILLLLFVGTAELGRLFYTYTTLAKATKVGARYLSTQRDMRSADPTKVAAATLRGQRLVVCGNTDSCSGLQPIVPGLDISNPATNVKVTMVPSATAITRYVKVEIQAYSFQPGVFNLASDTGSSSSTFYFSLAPSIEMRYME